MGCLNSKPSYIANSAGGEKEYQERYLESKTLGEGEFGVVKLVHDVKAKDLINAKPLAVKYLRKGFTFKDNTLYPPLKMEMLQGEVEILRRLNGEVREIFTNTNSFIERHGLVVEDKKYESHCYFTWRRNFFYNSMISYLIKSHTHNLICIVRNIYSFQCYNLKLESVYESPSMIYMITEYCEGGEMVPYVSTAFQDKGGMRTEDVSRICYQLWSAVNHCAKHKVIHRDIKPENVMFKSLRRGSELRLIDFGSGTLDGVAVGQNEGDDDIDRHHTFAGSAFYISPEMFQRNYTPKTDVWSAGATLYVLVAGYPAERLQEAFNTLQSTKQDRLRQLPNIPDNMPDSFYEMLDGALTYKQKGRLTADELMNGEFAQFHIEYGGKDNNGTLSIEDVAAEAAGEAPEEQEQSGTSTKARTKSVLLEGSVYRHNAYLGYQKFERSVTTILATMLTKEHGRQLLALMEEEGKKASTHNGNALRENIEAAPAPSQTNREKLQVVTIATLLEGLERMKDGALITEDIEETMKMIKRLKDFNHYETFAYHISNLRQFVATQKHTRQGSTKRGLFSKLDGSDSLRNRSVHGGNVFNSMRVRRGLDNSSTRRGSKFIDLSVKSVGGLRRVNTATGTLSTLS